MIIRVRVKAESKKDSLERVDSDLFKIEVKDRREMGEANRKVLRILAEHFGLSEKKFKITKGHRSPSKTIKIV